MKLAKLIDDILRKKFACIWLKKLSMSICFLVISFNINARPENIDVKTEQTQQEYAVVTTLLDERAESVNQAITNPFALSQHRLNYILPVSYVSDPKHHQCARLEY